MFTVSNELNKQREFIDRIRAITFVVRKQIAVLGCGDGWLPLALIDAGASFVLGLDSNVDQIVKARSMTFDYHNASFLSYTPETCKQHIVSFAKKDIIISMKPEWDSVAYNIALLGGGEILQGYEDKVDVVEYVAVSPPIKLTKIGTGEVSYLQVMSQKV